MTKCEELLVSNIENITKTSLLLLIDNIYNNYKDIEWSYDLELPSIFKELFHKGIALTLDLENILNASVDYKENLLLEIRNYQSNHVYEMFKLTQYRNYVNLLSLKLSSMNTFLVNKNLEIDIDTLETSLSNYLEKDTNNDLSKLLTYFPVITDENIIDVDLRAILKKDFSTLELDESCIAYINLKNYLLPTSYESYGTSFLEIKNDIEAIENQLKTPMVEEVFNELRNKLNAIENLAINIISDLNIIFENFNSLIILITNIEKFDILFEKDLVLRDMFYTFKSIVNKKETSEVIEEQFTDILGKEIEKYIDAIKDTSLKIDEVLQKTKNLSERENAIFYGYNILHNLFYSDVETSFSTTTYLLYTFDAKYFNDRGLNKDNLVDKILDDFLEKVSNSDDFLKKSLFAQLFRTINYTKDKKSLQQSFSDYFKEIDDYKKVQYENLLYFLKGSNKN